MRWDTRLFFLGKHIDARLFDRSHFTQGVLHGRIDHPARNDAR